jgi:hypothetical protein
VPVCPGLGFCLECWPRRDKATVRRNEMAVSASITSGSGTALVARLRVLAALTEGLRARVCLWALAAIPAGAFAG